MLIVQCPTCKTDVEWSDKNSFKPFCSERCKLIDLGAWADGSYAVPGQEVDPNNMDQYLEDKGPGNKGSEDEE